MRTDPAEADPVPPAADPGEWLTRLIFASRWLLAPAYFGLVAALAAVSIRWVLALAQAAAHVADMPLPALVVQVLRLIDLSLLGNLVVTVMIGGWENFIAPLPSRPGRGRPDWLEHLDFEALKLKVIGSLAAITGIDLLETFLDIHAAPKADVLWEVVIFLAFPVAALLMGLGRRH
jgi:uncharacterized protein (TIGR00645 family)